MITEHAVLPPSGAVHWVHCGGYITLTHGYEEEPTESTMEGDAMHWVAEQCLNSYRGNQGIKLSIGFLDTLAPNGVLLTEELIDAVEIYIADCLKIMQETGTLGTAHVEERVSCTRIHPQCWGTPDFWAFDSDSGTLHLSDFKGGHSSVVAEENWQLIIYAMGILDELTDGDALGDNGITVHMRICQPRCYYDGQGAFRDWIVPAAQLRGYVNKLQIAAELAFNGGECQTGPWCHNCSASLRCPAATAVGAAIIDRSSPAVPHEPTPELLAYELDLIEHSEMMIKQRKEALVTLAEHMIKSGGSVPGRRMEQKYSNNQWLEPEDDVIAMGELFGVDLTQRKILTPSQAVSTLKKNNVDGSVITSYYGKKPTGTKLVKDTVGKIFQRQRG